eukprot:gene1057-765_t
MTTKSADDLYVEDPDESDFIVVQEHVLDREPSPDIIDRDDNYENLGGFAPTFNPEEYESQEMKRLIAMHAPDEVLPAGLDDLGYRATDIFPDWILQNSLWKNAPKKAESNEISEILNIPVSKRSQDQNSKLIHWLMSVWQTANQMGFKRCGSMFKEFNYNIFQPNENIITEGERGLTFYIIISGTTVVSKEGIGVVGQLGKGKSFGEIALTQGKDLRTATVTAQTRVEVLSLHKQNYDIFVRDILEMERRENFQLLANCTLFKNWAKGKIEKMCNTCTRRSFEDGQYIFRQGDPPGDLLIIVEGGVSIFKELVIITKNRWPVGLRDWKERVRRTTKPIMLKTLGRGEYFGEIAILKNVPRSTSAIAQGRCVLLAIDKAEFLFLLNLSTLPIKSLKDEQAILTENLSKYYDDMQVMETVQHIKGGPQSVAYVGQLRAEKAQIDEKVIKEYARDSEDIEIMKPSSDPAGVSLHEEAAKNPATGTATGGGDGGKSPKKSHSKSIRTAVMEAKVRKQRALESRNMDYARAFEKNAHGHHPHHHRGDGHVERGVSVAATHLLHSQLSLPIATTASSGLPTMPAAKANLRLQSQQIMREKLDAHKSNRRGSISFQAGSGLDNDATTTYAFDSNKVVMRRNSVIRLGQVYEHVYQRIQLEAAAESAASAAAAAMFGGPIQRTATIDVFGMPPPRSPGFALTAQQQKSPPRGRTMSPSGVPLLSRQASAKGGGLRGSQGDLSKLLSQSRGGLGSQRNLSRTPSSAALRSGKSSRGLGLTVPTSIRSVGLFEPYKEATVPILHSVLAAAPAVISSNIAAASSPTTGGGFPAVSSPPPSRGGLKSRAASFVQ